jgi:ubiquinone/menaquinone biosynthesis C-methylase UbiE
MNKNKKSLSYVENRFMTENHFKTSEKTWDTIAESFDNTRRKPWQEVVGFVNILSSLDIVVDLGCGNGRHLIPCAKHCKHIIGLDISRNLLNITKNKTKEKNLGNVAFVHGNLVKIPLKDSSLDAVLYIASLHNIKGREDRIRSLKEVKRILKNNGRSLISVWSREQEKFRDCFTDLSHNDYELGDITIYWRQNRLNVPRFYHLYSKEEFVEDLKQSGLEIEQISEAKLHSKMFTDNYFAIVRKG